MKNILLIGALLLTQGLFADNLNPPEPGKPVFISEVMQVDLIVLNKSPQVLIVRAQGITNSNGWQNGVLIPKFSVKKNNDGIYHFDFVANPPQKTERNSTGSILITGEYIFKSIPENIKTVVVYAEKNKIEKKYAPLAELSKLAFSCVDSKRGGIIFNKGGDYKIVLQKLEMGKRTDVSLCMGEGQKCWEHLQYFDEGSAMTLSGIMTGSELALYSNELKNDSPAKMRMNTESCPPREGYVYFEDANGFRLILKIVPVELFTEVVQ